MKENISFWLTNEKVQTKIILMILKIIIEYLNDIDYISKDIGE